MAIFDFDYNLLQAQLTPDVYSFAQNVKWVNSICKPIVWLRDCLFTSFAKGASAVYYSDLTNYNFGDRVQWGESIYECLVPTIGNNPTIKPDYWVLVVNDRIGVNTRIKYKSDKLIFEFALNQRFKTVFRQPNHLTSPAPSDIYIQRDTVVAGFLVGQTFGDTIGLTSSSKGIPLTAQTSSNDFIIFVPIAKYTALGSNAEKIIRFWADKINLAGMSYTIQTY